MQIGEKTLPDNINGVIFHVLWCVVLIIETVRMSNCYCLVWHAWAVDRINCSRWENNKINWKY